jgi:aspartyl/asparaginyl beta-hydroxylase (cupin superfamily)
LNNKNPTYFYSSKEFEQLLFLEEAFLLIKNELLELISKNQDTWLNTFPSYVNSVEKNAWQVFTFSFFQMKNTTNEGICPQTASIINKIPGLISCDFSRLKKQTHILPHKGYSKMILRCHLPLIIPNREACGIRVGEETKNWEEGKLLIFDDSYEHEAWNTGDKDRFVLMFDIPNPLWEYTADEISQYKMEQLDDPFLLQFATKEEWLAAYRQRKLPIEQINFRTND